MGVRNSRRFTLGSQNNRNNETAWMVNGRRRWVKKLDRRCLNEGRNIILLIDNFSNMTSFVQPLDQGIIRCFKAHYRKQFCLRAIDLDEAGAENIYEINLLEVMLMSEEAWKAVQPKTVANCWKHSGIRYIMQTCTGG